MAKTLTRSELYKRISAGSGQSARRVVKPVMRAALEEMAKHLAGGGNVVLRGFGTFVIKKRNERIGRCPRKPEMGEFVIPAHMEVVFVPADDLHSEVIKLPIGV